MHPSVQRALDLARAAVEPFEAEALSLDKVAHAAVRAVSVLLAARGRHRQDAAGRVADGGAVCGRAA